MNPRGLAAIGTLGHGAGRRGGAVLWFTGLSGSGKSTLADMACKHLLAAGADVERLDGDAVRALFPKIGFSRQARNEHIKRMGHLASLLEKHGVIVLASFISPYRSSRAAARSFCRNFFEIYLSARLPECEGRDVKGHYRRARAGRLPKFTGIGDGYEPPLKPELSIDTGHQTPEASFERLRPLLDRLARGVRRK